MKITYKEATSTADSSANMFASSDEPFLHFTKWVRADGTIFESVPMMMTKDFRIDRPLTDYLRSLVIARKAEQTVAKTAEILLRFLLIVKSSKAEIFTVNEHFLILWKDYLLNYRGIATQTFKDYISVVLDFYWWAEQNGYVSFMIGQDRPEDDVFYRINVAKTVLDNGKIYLDTPIRKGTSRSTHKVIPKMPSAEALEALAVELTEAPLPWVSERNAIGLRMIRNTGVRRSELVNIPLTSIPSAEDLDRMIGEGAPIVLALTKTKGGKPRDVQVTVTLMRRLRNWIDYERKQVIEDKIAAGALARDEGFVFISSKTGRRLDAQSFTNLIKDAARRAGYPNVTPHRVRHRHLTELLVSLLEEGRTPTAALLELMDRAGHAKLSTAKIYQHPAELMLEHQRAVAAASAVSDEARAAAEWERDNHHRMLALSHANAELAGAFSEVSKMVADGSMCLSTAVAALKGLATNVEDANG